jgi:methionine synthase II (cobalamin-independent)
MPYIEFGCRATAIGSMPHKDPAAACSLVTRYLKDIPTWPQLPNRSFLENMVVQFSEGFPGVVVEEERVLIGRRVENSIYVNRRRKDVVESSGQLYVVNESHDVNDVDKYPTTAEYAKGLHAFLAMKGLSPLAVKGQITGPLTWGLTVKDEQGQAIIYDDTYQDMVAVFLGLKAGWQGKQLRQISKNTIIFIDEPYMASFGSAFVSISAEKVVSLINEVLDGISGIKGVHCCGNTDWSVLLKTTTQILSFDAYNYAQSLSLYPAEIKQFLDRQGTIAWGIVPNELAALDKESVASLRDRLEEAMAPFARKGIPFRQLVAQGLLTPCCGLAPLRSEEAAARALELLAELSATIRKRYA